jgi:iron only hydrogenase large subunit-like protein
MVTLENQHIVFTNKASCRDCYRCLRVCPVKAIKMENGQAFVIQERCILCGNCIKECPQHAKSYRREIEKAKQLILDGYTVAISIAPSFAAAFEEWELPFLPSALRKLGFQVVSETSIGAFETACQSAVIAKNNPHTAHICTACPAVVNYTERYAPEQLPRLINVVSPMIAHAQLLKQKYGSNAKVVFAGPCVAKKGEAERPEFAGIVNAVLTFEELREWLEEEKIEFKYCESSNFDESPVPDATLFPLTGGLIKTANLSTDILSKNSIMISGSQELEDAYSYLSSDSEALIEPLFCTHGCINGPGMGSSKSLVARKLSIIDYAKSLKPVTIEPQLTAEQMKTKFEYKEIKDTVEITEDAIRAIHRKTGKETEKDLLNCGACGYPSCRDKAIAVIRGYAELEMCIPYVRKLAQQRTDKIIETSPNGIVILNEKLEILTMNPAFVKFFRCSKAIIGNRIATLMDPEPFEKLLVGDEETTEVIVNHGKFGFTAHEKIYKLKDDDSHNKVQIVGIFVDITKSILDKKKLDALRTKTIMQAQELLDHQISMAQELAKFLGESTARGEDLVENLIKLTDDEQKSSKDDRGKWLRDIYTSK